jgi:hypothetical protein
MNAESYPGLGRRQRRLMKKIWKEARGRQSLKAWARSAEIGELAHVWLRNKRPSKGA